LIHTIIEFSNVLQNLELFLKIEQENKRFRIDWRRERRNKGNKAKLRGDKDQNKVSPENEIQEGRKEGRRRENR